VKADFVWLLPDSSLDGEDAGPDRDAFTATTAPVRLDLRRERLPEGAQAAAAGQPAVVGAAGVGVEGVVKPLHIWQFTLEPSAAARARRLACHCP
jgi:hypothetical protein